MTKAGQFGVALNESHFRDLLFELIPPPAQQALAHRSGPNDSATRTANPSADLMMMGFPTRLPDTSPPSLCVCHAEIKTEGFLCPRCLAKLCDVPTDCDICGLMIVSSPHLARSYHHLFPVKTFDAMYVASLFATLTLSLMVHCRLSADQISNDSLNTCNACSRPFPAATTVPAIASSGLSPFGRYRCPDCRSDFCSECDVFVHDVLHCCPGCGK